MTSRKKTKRLSTDEAEAILSELAAVFLSAPSAISAATNNKTGPQESSNEPSAPTAEVMYRALVEQIPAVVFIAYLDRGVGNAYVSPQIEAALGFSQAEWLEDPIRWYQQIHPDDKSRWSIDAAEMLVTGNPVKSAYRVLARDGTVVWFRCEVKMVRRDDGQPWFIHGVGFDISDIKRAEKALEERSTSLRDLSSQLLQAQDNERRRIARELHDSLGQYLAALKMILNMASESETNNKRLSDAEEIVDRCISETRTLSHLLHPPLLDEVGLASAIQWYIEGFTKRSGIDVRLEVQPQLRRLPQAIETALFRVLQESLTNIHRHSGSACAEIWLGIDDSEMILTVKDYGHGIPSRQLERFRKNGTGVGVGLLGMRERVAELGGRLEVNSDTKGTVLHARIPITDTTDD
jgi:PAS domain S-box-containing protein